MQQEKTLRVFAAVFFLAAVVRAQELKLEDQCFYNEIPNFSLQDVVKPAKILDTFVGKDWLTDRFSCYSKCCSDEFQIAGNGRCTAVSYHVDKKRNQVCQLVQCHPEEACRWSHGKAGFLGAFIRSEKTTTPAPTTTTSTPHTTPVVSVTVGGVHVPLNTSANVALGGNQTHPEGTNKTEGAPQHEGTPQQSTPPSSWNNQGETTKPDEINIEPVQRSHQVPTRGLVAGIVLAILLVLALVSFLAKQLKSIKQPSRYKPIYAEEYEKLTVGEET